MNLNDFNSSLNKLEQEPKNEKNFFSEFLKDFQNLITSFLKNSQSNNLLQDSIYVIRDINDNKLSVVNIENGEESDLYIVTSKSELEELNSKGIFDNIYEMPKEDFYSLNLGSNLEIKGQYCTRYYGEIKIENAEAASKLENLYFCLEDEKDAIYSVSSLSDDKIYLTNVKEGGYFSIPKEAYPNFKIGDLLKQVDGKYILK